MLGRGVHDVAVAVVAHDRGVDIGEDYDDGEEHEDDDVGLFAEEHAEHAVPVGIARRGYLLHRGLVLGHALEELLVREAGVVQAYEVLLCCNSHLKSPRFGCVGDTRVHDRHEYVAHDGGDDEQYPVEQRHADDDGVVVGAYGLHQQSADAGDEVDLLHDYRAGERAGYRAGDAVDYRYGRVLEDVLGEDLPLAQALAAGELDVVGVHLVHHVAPHPAHLARYGAYGRGRDGHYVHEPGRVVQREGRRQAQLVAHGLEHQHIGEARHGHYQHDVGVAEAVDPGVLALRHQYAQRQAYHIGQGRGDDADDEGVVHARAAVLDERDVGVVVVVEVGVDQVELPRAGEVGGRVQVVRALLHGAGGVICRGAHVVALWLDHGLKGVHALVDAVARAEVDGQEVLMYEWKTVVEVEQVLVVGTAAEYGRGELLPAVGRVVEREGQAAVGYILFDVVYVVKFKDAREEVPQANNERGVLVGEQAGCAAGGDAVRRGHYRVKADHRVALGLVLGGEALDVPGRLFAVALGRAPDRGRLGALLLAQLPRRDQLVEPVGVGDVVEVVVLLPFLIHIERSLVVAQLYVLLVLSEDERGVQP